MNIAAPNLAVGPNANRVEVPRLTAARLKQMQAKWVKDLPQLAHAEFNDVGAVRRALMEMETTGRMYQAAGLVDAMGRDGRIASNCETRFGGLLSLPLTITPANDTPEAERIASLLRDKWDDLFPPEQMQSLLQWGRMVGVGLGSLEWKEEDGLWWPRLESWRPRFVSWRSDRRTYWVSTQDHGTVEVTPGDGQWVLLTPGGNNAGWLSALVRSLSVPFLINGWGWRDWARHSETLGIPVKKAVVPMEASDADKQQFLEEVAALATESCVKTERSSIPNGPQYDVEVEEWGTTGASNFDMLLTKAERAIDFRMLGQTQAQDGGEGGSLAKASVHYRVRGDLIASDEKLLMTALRRQIILPWMDANFGNRKLAPRARYDARPPEDKGARAATLVQVGVALKNFTDQSVPVDSGRMLADFNVPLREDASEDKKKKAGQIYGYHLTAGVLTVDEVRESLGKPPIGGAEGKKLVGQQPPPEPGGPPRAQLSEAAENALSMWNLQQALLGQPVLSRELLAARLSGMAPGAPPAPKASPSPEPGADDSQRYMDELVREGRSLAALTLKPDIAALREALRGAGTPDEARAAIVAAFKGMDPGALADVLEKGAILANLAGRHGVLEEL